MKSIYQLQQIANLLRQVTEANSISPEDTFGLVSDILEYLAAMEQTADGRLGIHKVYTSYASMAADGLAPIGSNGKALRDGHMVSVYDPSNPTQEENGNIYAWQKDNTDSHWMLVANLGSVYNLAVAVEGESNARHEGDETLLSRIDSHTGDGDIHVTSAQKDEWGAKYVKPSGGIPKGDLAASVKTSLNKADSALQEHQDVSDIRNNIATLLRNMAIEKTAKDSIYVNNSNNSPGEQYHASLFGTGNVADGYGAFCGGHSCHTGDRSATFNTGNNASGSNSFSAGENNKASNRWEASFGRFNVSNTGNDDADKTRFSVGIGTDENNRKNAFEVRANGDFWTWLDGAYARLQDFFLRKMRIVESNSASIEASVNSYHLLPNDMNVYHVELPIVATGHLETLILSFRTGTQPNLTLSCANGAPIYFENGLLSLEPSKTYEVECRYNCNAWLISARKFETQA